jgi:hypothetical protein|nr:MAG TPA: Major head protein [Caudoviricetes sp.]
MTDNNTQNTTQQANTQPEGNGPAEKMFTQEEVNNIVRERLNRVKAGAAEQDERATALDEREAAVQQREQAMQQKESRVACEDHCKAKGYDTAFLDLLDTSDPERFTVLLDKLHETAAADLKAHQEAEQATQAEQSAAQRLEHMELDNALAQQAAGLKFSSESARQYFLAQCKEQDFALQGGQIVGFDEYVKAFKESDPSAILPAGGIARFSASATGAPLSAGNRDAIKDAFKPKG